MLSVQNRKDELSERGVTLTKIAEQVGVSPVTVRQVVNGLARSRRIEKAVARAIGRAVSDVFPPPRPIGRPRRDEAA